MKKNKKAKFSPGIITSAIIGIVILVVLFQFYAGAIPSAQTAGDSMSDTNRCASDGFFWNTTDSYCQASAADTTLTEYNSIPLNTLFSGTGIVFLIIMAALIILVVKSFMSGK